MARPAARSHPADVVLPGVNALVRLTIGAGPGLDDDPVATNVPSRIEDVVPADPRVKGSRPQLLVAVPHYAGDVNVPRPGAACAVSWVSSDGVYDLPTGFLERVVVGPTVWAWRVEVIGHAERAQRRRFVRVPWTRPIVVDVVPVARLFPQHHAGDGVDGAEGGAGAGDGVDGAEDDLWSGGGTVHGSTLDLSEGGVRCVLPPPPVRSGQPVRVHLEVQGDQLVLDGTVVRVKATVPRPGAHPQYETGIAFTEPDLHGDLLRRAVFSEQLRSRRSGME
jgi:hypothetical protein